MNPENNLLRKWSPSQKADTEVRRLEEKVSETRKKIQQLKEHGQQMRSRRMQAMEALNTRQITLTEILRRMEQELKDKDVFEYGDVLAEIFGERKIFAARAIGLESLLCQLMHQMLAKQHQLKIMKRAAKDIQAMMKKHKMQYNEEFFSFEALAVQLEVSRLNMEAMYDEIFTAQHRILALLKNEKPMANPSIRSTKANIPQAAINLPVSSSSNKRPSSKKEHHRSLSNQHESEEEGDYESAMAVLSTPTNYEAKDGHFQEEKKAPEQVASVKASLNNDKTSRQRREDRKNRRAKSGNGSSSSITSATSEESSSFSPKKNSESKGRNVENTSTNTSMQSTSKPSSSRPSQSRTKKGEDSDLVLSPSSSDAKKRHAGNKSARERRRQIEQMRLGRVVGGASTQQRSPSQIDFSDEDSSGENKKGRDRLRELEKVAKKRGSSGNTKGRWPPSKSGENGAGKN